MPNHPLHRTRRERRAAEGHVRPHKPMRLKVTPSDVSTRMLFTVVRLTATDVTGADAVGTGFFFESEVAGKRVDYLFTNKHVVEGADSVSFRMHGPASDRPQYANLGQQALYTTAASSANATISRAPKGFWVCSTLAPPSPLTVRCSSRKFRPRPECERQQKQ